MTLEEIRERYLSGETNEFGTLKDLLILSLGEMTERGQDRSEFARIIWALTRMDTLLDEKLKLLDDTPKE